MAKTITIGAEITGADEAITALGEMRSAAAKAEFAQSLLDLGDKLVDQIKEDAPVSESQYTPPGHEPGTLRDQGIGQHTIIHSDDGVVAVYIGFTEIGWYGIFSEFGTVNEPARPFFIPVFDRNHEMIVQAISDGYYDAILRDQL